MATKKQAKPVKKAAKKWAKKAPPLRIRVTNPNFGKKQKDDNVKKKYDKIERDCCAMEVQRTPEQEAYERGKRHALSENPMVSTATQISGVKNNLRWMEEEQRRDELVVFHLQTQMAERQLKMNHMRSKVDELGSILDVAIRESIK